MGGFPPLFKHHGFCLKKTVEFQVVQDQARIGDDLGEGHGG